MNIALVEDHVMLAQLLNTQLEQSLQSVDIRLFVRAKSFLEHTFEEWQPDIVISDILMPDMNGIEMLEKVRPSLRQECKIILLSSITDAGLVKEAISKNVDGYVAKGATLDELLEAIRTVQQGKKYISQALKDDLLDYMLADKPTLATLSPRENEVLQKLCAGLTPKEIAYEMNLSVSTVQLYNKTLLRKFKINRTTDLVMFAIKNGLYKKLSNL